MNKYWTMIILLIGLSACLITAAQAEVAVGEPVPNFTANDTQGNPQSLSAHKGKYVVLEWLNPDCPFVKKHYNSGNMQQLQTRYTNKGVVWLTINSSAPGKQGHYDAEDTNRMMMEKQSNVTAVILDPDGMIGRIFGAATTPHMFVIDPEGTLIYQGAIDDTPGTDPDEIAESQNYVTAALDSAMNGQPVEVVATKSYGCSVKY